MSTFAWPRAGTTLRILPPGMYARRGHVVLEREFRVYRRGFLVLRVFRAITPAVLPAAA